MSLYHVTSNNFQELLGAFLFKLEMRYLMLSKKNNQIYYLPINNSSFELSVFWLSDTECMINELRFSDSVSLSFKTRLTSVSCFAATLRKVNFQAWNQRWKHDDMKSRNVT